MKRTKEFDRSRKQVLEIFASQLNARKIAEFDGPNGSEMQWWPVNGRIIIVQIYSTGGWDYYLPGKENRLDEITGAILNELGE